MQILAEEITPTLKRLKEERSSYLEFQKVTREVEQLSRFSIAYQFVQDEVKMAEACVSMEDPRISRGTRPTSYAKEIGYASLVYFTMNIVIKANQKFG